MKITYGDGWFRGKKMLTKTWDAARAKKCHEKRQLYAVVVSDDDAPSCFVELNMGYVGVGFLVGQRHFSRGGNGNSMAAIVSAAVQVGDFGTHELMRSVSMPSAFKRAFRVFVCERRA